MLDPHGFVATCNSVNFFCVRKGEVWAPQAKYQLHGITRANVLALCRRHGVACRELDFTLTQVRQLCGSWVCCFCFHLCGNIRFSPGTHSALSVKSSVGLQWQDAQRTLAT